MNSRAKSFLVSLLTLCFCPKLFDTAAQPSHQKFWPNHLMPFNHVHASRENREIDPETKEPYLEHKRLLKKELIQPTESSVSKNEILDHEDVYYDTVEGDYHYFGNGELYDQVAQDNINRRTYHFRRFPFAKRPKTQLAKPVLTYHKPESGQYDSHYQTPQKTPPPWANFLQTVITCLPLSLAAAAVPLGFIDFSGTTSTLTMTPITVTTTATTTITEEGEGEGPVLFGRISSGTIKRPKEWQAINVQPANLPQHDQMSIGCSYILGNSSWLRLSPTPVVNGNESASDLSLVKHHPSNWTSDEPELTSVIQSKVDAKVNLQQQSKNQTQEEGVQHTSLLLQNNGTTDVADAPLGSA